MSRSIRVCQCAKSLKVHCFQAVSHSFGPMDLTKWKIFNIFSDLLSRQAGCSFTLWFTLSRFWSDHLGSKNPWRSWNSHIIFSGGPIGTSCTSQKNFGGWGPHPLFAPGPPNVTLGGSWALYGVRVPDPKIFLGSPGSPNRSSRKN